jgi:hypothetical protein
MTTQGVSASTQSFSVLQVSVFKQFVIDQAGELVRRDSARDVVGPLEQVSDDRQGPLRSVRPEPRVGAQGFSQERHPMGNEYEAGQNNM